MAIKKTHVATRLPAGRQGFVLLIAIIFMSVMLSFGLALGSLGYKQQVLASGATASQYAFYAADAGLECALYADQQLDSFNYAAHDGATHPNVITCDNALATELLGSYSYTSTRLVVSERVALDKDSNGNPTRCADVTVYKPKPGSGGTTYIFSQGYNISCTAVSAGNSRFVSRGIGARY